MPTDDHPARRPKPPSPAIEERRDQVIATLAAHFAADRLTMTQLEERMDGVHRAVTAAQLEDLVADLPVLADPAARTVAPAQGGRLADPSAVRERQVLVAVMGGVERRGHWVPAKRTMVVTFMGGAELDLREAALPADGAEIAILAIWGGVEIVVPPDVRIDMGGMAIMGGFEQRRGYVPDPGPGAPVVRITGFALMGGVEVSVRYPGESASDAKRRVREERKRLRDGPSRGRS